MWVYLYPNNTETELKNAYIGQGIWKPWSNTIAYYPLTDDFSDHKWSGTLYNLTNNTVSGNSVNLTTLNWVKCADMNWAYLSADFVINTLPCTLVFWNKWKSVNTNIFYLAFADSTRNWWWWWLTILNTSTLRIRWWGSSYKYSDVSYSIDTNWHMYCLVLSSSWWYLYIDDDKSFNPTNALNNPSWSWTPFRIGANEVGGSWFGNGYMWEVILENKAWTATEKSKYYNLTKSNYWL